jgi:hypothetical protein
MEIYRVKQSFYGENPYSMESYWVWKGSIFIVDDLSELPLPPQRNTTEDFLKYYEEMPLTLFSK